MNPIENILQKFPLVILDGAMATELERHGCDLNDSLWSATIIMENSELIKQVHTDYFTAGADCAITASYQATVEGFARRGLSEGERINNSGLTGFVHSTFKRTINIHCNENGELFTKGENELGK